MTHDEMVAEIQAGHGVWYRNEKITSVDDLPSDVQIAADTAADAEAAQPFLNPLLYKGVIDCSANPNYPAADAGHVYLVSVAGKIGGASGVTVEAGDMAICKTDSTAAGTQAQRGTAWNIVQSNVVGALLAANNLSDLLSASAARSSLGLGTLATQSGTFSGTSSGTNTGDQSVPVKATGAEVDTGTDDAKFITPKALADSSVGDGGASYLVYTALLSETPTDAPTAIILQNTVVGSVVLSRDSVGQYRLTNATFLKAKTVYFIPAINNAGEGPRVGVTVNDGYVLITTTEDDAGTLADGYLDKTPIEIRVYL